MMFKPKETKFTKYFKGRKFNKVRGCVNLQQMYAPKKTVVLRALNHARFSEKLLLTLRQTLAKKIKKQGKLDVKLLADVPVSKKPLEIRMGKGKGAIDCWVAKVAPGMHIIEITELSVIRAVKLLTDLQKKLPIRTYIDLL